MAATPVAVPPAPGEEPVLKRAISRNVLLLFVVGDVLGAGIYALVGEVGGRVGGAIWAAFLLALLLAVFTAFAYAELVTKYPQAAGAALYVNKAFRVPFVTFMVAFAVMASGLTSAATLSRAFGGDYLSDFVDLPTALVAVCVLGLLALVNARGIGESVKLNVGLTLVELTGLLLVALIGTAALLDGVGDPGRALEIKDGESLVPAVMAGAGLAFYALIGFEDSVNVAEETREPQRDYPRALFGGLAIAGVIYLAVSTIATMAVPTNTLAESSGPLLEVVQLGPLSVDTKIFSAIALFALVNGALINLIMASRLVFGMARQGIMPAPLARVLPGRRTPWVAIIVTTAIAMCLALVSDLSTLADMTVLLLLVVFVAVNVSVLVLRRDTVDHDHFRAPTIIPVIGIVVSIAVMTSKDLDVFWRAGLLLLLGAALYLVNVLVTRQTAQIDTGVLQAVEHPERD
ncbi:APC family permease [Conexibacter sp. SYSU D00693]|uniref:APC family permease n=1 Tax=Conexibacter sp. SYSU D00693 TaxID=2812560 RepID=UPI00196A6A27|nr:APC family permease [Conexibacter sp. SYSU D00693]